MVEEIVLGGGCFWCVEAVYERIDGVISVEAAYAGGNTDKPTYKEVCSGETGHAEVAKITFDPEKVKSALKESTFLVTIQHANSEVGTLQDIKEIGDYVRGKGILFHNESKTDYNWIKIRIAGTKSNRDGFGAKIKISTSTSTQTKSLVSGQSYFSMHAKELHFGLGTDNIVKNIEVIWPSGIVEIFKDIPANQTIFIEEGIALHQNTFLRMKKL